MYYYIQLIKNLIQNLNSHTHGYRDKNIFSVENIARLDFILEI